MKFEVKSQKEVFNDSLFECLMYMRDLVEETDSNLAMMLMNMNKKEPVTFNRKNGEVIKVTRIK